MSPGLPSVNPIMSLTVALLPGGMETKDGWPRPNCRLKSECWPLPHPPKRTGKMSIRNNGMDRIRARHVFAYITSIPVHLPITMVSYTLMPERMGFPETDKYGMTMSNAWRPRRRVTSGGGRRLLNAHHASIHMRG
jgi:hypothetical protein